MINRKITYCLLFLIAAALGKETPFCAAGPNLQNLLREALQTAQSMPFEGVLTFRRKLDPHPDSQKTQNDSQKKDNVFESTAKICRVSATQKKMEILKPEFLAHSIVAEVDGTLWMKQIDEERMKKLPREIKYYQWYRIFRDLTAAVSSDKLKLLLNNYNLVQENLEKIAHRNTFQILIEAKNKNRPSVRIWIDAKTRMPLKYNYYDYAGEWQETVEFERISMEKDDIYCRIDTADLSKISPPETPHENDENLALDFIPYQVETPPRGFQLTSTHIFRRAIKDKPDGPSHNAIIYSMEYEDGLANFTVFQRKLFKEELEDLANSPEEERDKVKLLNDTFYYRDLNGIRMLIVGNLHPRGKNYTLHNMKPLPQDEKNNLKDTPKAQPDNKK